MHAARKNRSTAGYSDFILPGLKKGQRSISIVQNTKFGWILSGPVHDKQTAIWNFRLQCNFIELDIQQQLGKFWKQEKMPNENANSKNDCIKLFKETYQKNENYRRADAVQEGRNNKNWFTRIEKNWLKTG